MLDQLVILRKNGVVLWSQSYGAALRLDAVDALVKNLLLEQRGGADFYFDGSAVKWLADNEQGLLVAAVYQRTLSLTYVESLLNATLDDFAQLFRNLKIDERDNQAQKKNQALLVFVMSSSAA